MGGGRDVIMSMGSKPRSPCPKAIWMWLQDQEVSKAYVNGASSKDLATHCRTLGEMKTLGELCTQTKSNCSLLRCSEPFSPSVSHDPSPSTVTSAALQSKMIKGRLRSHCPQRGLKAIHTHPTMLGNSGRRCTQTQTLLGSGATSPPYSIP